MVARCAALLLFGVLALPAASVASDPSPTASASAAAPPWFKAGLRSLLDDLWDEEAGAVSETAAPIDHGDRWAWTGDNAKVLSTMVAGAAADDDEAQAMAGFVLGMHEGPLLFKRWANMGDPVVVQDNGSGIQVSNHLYTLDLDPRSGEVAVVMEYHDGRNKQMASFAAPRVKLDGAWKDLAPGRGKATVEDGTDSVVVTIPYVVGSAKAWQSFRLDASPRVEQTLRWQGTAPEAVRFVQGDLTVKRHDRESDPAFYHELVTPDLERQEVAQRSFAAPSSDPAWFMLLDAGTTDEFATGLLVRPHDGFQAVEVTRLTPEGHGAIAMETEFDRAPDGLTSWTQDVTPLDGVLTDEPAVYASLAAKLTSPAMASKDPSLSYEYCETVLGLVDQGSATQDDAAVQEAVQLFRHYLAFYPRGTQTRSLASGIGVALALREATGNDTWLDTARTLAEALHGYQVEKDAPDAGAVINEPGGGPFLDSTVAAARRWHDLHDADPDPRWLAWSDAAWASLASDDDRIFFRDTPSEDNSWSFKSGLVLQAAPALRPDLLWAARNHLWNVTRDLATYEVHTSRFSAETNSETQAWALQGLLQDWSTRSGPWIVDADVPLHALPGNATASPSAPASSPTVVVPFPGAFVWTEPGWLGFEDGIPAERTPDALGTWRYTAQQELRFIAAHEQPLGPGLHAISFPGVTRPAPVERVLQGLPVDIAWSYNGTTREWLWWLPDGTGNLAMLVPGQGLLVHLRDAAVLEQADVADTAVAPRPGWTLTRFSADVASEPGARAVRWDDPTRAADPGDLALVSFDEEDVVPAPLPMLVLGRVDDPYAYRLQGGVVRAETDLGTAGEAAILRTGAFRFAILPPSGHHELWLSLLAPDGRQVSEQALAFHAGTLVEPALATPDRAQAAPTGLVILVSLAAATIAAIALAILWRRAVT